MTLLPNPTPASPAPPPAPPARPATPAPPAPGEPSDPPPDPAPPAPGERPAFLPEAAWKDGAIDLAGLEAHLGTLQAPAADLPASADAYALPEIENFDREKAAASPIFKALMVGAFENKIGQEAFNGVIKTYVEQMTADEDARYTAEMEKMGANAGDRLAKVSNFIASQVPADQAAILRQMVTTADAVAAFEALMNRNANPQPRADPPPVSQRKTKAEIEALMATPAYSGRPSERNPAVIAEVDKWFEDEAAKAQAQ